MRPIPRVRHCMGLLMLALLIGCGDETPTEPVVRPGTFAFTYSGPLSGSVSVTGTCDMEDLEVPNESCAAAVDTGEEMIVRGVRLSGANTADIAALLFPPEEGTYDLEACLTSELCGGHAWFGLDFTTEEALALLIFTSGEIRVTEVSAERVKGTFSGTAEVSGGEGVFVITGGTFDVPVLQ